MTTADTANIGSMTAGVTPLDPQDFVRRYEQGPPAEGYTAQEALAHYGQVAPQLPPEDYQQVAREAFARLSPQERVQFGQYLAQQAQQQGYTVPELHRAGVDERFGDPAYLAQVTGQIHQQPGLLRQLLGAGAGSGLPGAAGLPGAGQAAGSDLLGNPLAKVALGGIAALGLTRLLGGGGRSGC